MSRMFDHGEALPPPVETIPSTRPSTPARQSDVSPKRDYQKVANSITRDAIPGGMFNGKAKQLYDCLYSLTRGAIVPSMTVRIARSDLRKKAGIGAKVTLEQNLRRLVASGLVSIKTISGIQGGNEYTVRLPEEAIPFTPPSTGASPPSPPSGGEKLGILAPLENSPPSHGVTSDYQRTSDTPKTSFKTDTNTDDEPMPLLRARAGKMPQTEAVLLSLLDTLEARTTVSSPDALLAHVLSQKLAPRGKSTQKRGVGEQFRGAPVAEFSEEELAELRKIEADIRAELERGK